VTDETSLIQGVKPTVKASDKPNAVSNLLSTATSLLKNGATPDVVEFAQATLTEITASVLPAIQDSHRVDQTLLDNTFTLFESALQNLEEENNDVKAAHDEERRLSQMHKTCRNDQERPICDSKRECDYDLHATWLHFIEQESELRQLSQEVENHFCVEDANGTLSLFRDRSVTLFPPWLEQKPIVEHWESEYDRKVPICEDLFNRLDDKTAECDALQAHLEAAACAHANMVLNVRIRFGTDWQYSVHAYQRVVDEVRCLEIDRWKEWRTLSTVQCLLERTNERNGRPCDEASDEITTEITDCEQHQADVDIDHLRITYHTIPDFPPQCAMPPWEGENADFHPGRCVPRDPKAPCSTEYEAQEYGDLWVPPQPEFHSENSHCNQRAECQTCELIVEPHWCICLYLWAYGQATGYWVSIPQADDTCHEATVAQLDAGFYSRVHVGTGYYVASATGGLDLMQLTGSAGDEECPR